MEFRYLSLRKLRKISDDDIKAKFAAALDQLFKCDIFLLQNGVRGDGSDLERGVHERSVAHKLAEYLQQQFSGWNVDCEYNRHGLRIKTIKDENKVYPDIVIHHRGVRDNLLVVELKTSSINEPRDAKKLEALTKIGKTEKYEYQLGLLLRLHQMKIKECTWYKNGQQEN